MKLIKKKDYNAEKKDTTKSVSISKEDKDNTQNDMLDDFDVDKDTTDIESNAVEESADTPVVNNKPTGEIVKPTFNTENKRKALVKVSEEQESYDDMNSMVIEDDKIKELNAADEPVEVVEKKKKKKKVNKIVLFSAIGGVVAIVATVIIVKEVTKGPAVNLVGVDVNQFVGTESTNTADDEIEYKATVTINESTIGAPISVGTYHEVITNINVKSADNTGYKDFEAPYYFGLDSVEFGHSNITDLVTSYNESTGKKINIGTAENLAENMQLAMFNVAIQYPANYPTNSNDGYARQIPEISVRIIGNPIIEDDETDNASSSSGSASETVEDTESGSVESTVEAETNETGTEEVAGDAVSDATDEADKDTTETDDVSDETLESSSSSSSSAVEEHYTNYVIIDGKRYDFSKMTSITVPVDKVEISSGYTYRCITTVPKYMKSNDYIIEITVDNNKAYYIGVDVK